MRNQKKVIIFITIIFFVIALTAIFLYFKTDLFVSNKKLFLRYLFNTEFVDKNILEKYKNLNYNISNSNYSSSGEVEYSIVTKDNETSIDNVNKLFNVKYNMLKNRNFNQDYADFTVNSDNEDVLTVRYLRDNNIHGIKIENVLRKYIAIENTNLKEFFTKLGAKNSTYVPNKISIADLKEIITLDDVQKDRIKNTYLNILIDNIDNNKFIKSKDKSNVTIISVSLTEKEVANILVKELEILKNDNESLNLIINKAKNVDYNLNIDSLKTYIQEQIDDINNSKNTNEEFIKVSIAEYNKKTVKLDVKIHLKDKNDNELKRELDFSIDLSQTHKIVVNIKNNENNINSELSYGYEENSASLNIDTILLDNQNNKINDLFKVIYQINKFNESSIENNALITYYSNSNNEKTQINLKDNKQLKQDIQIEKMTTENMELLNGKSKEDLEELLKAITDRITYVYGENSEIYTKQFYNLLDR